MTTGHRRAHAAAAGTIRRVASLVAAGLIAPAFAGAVTNGSPAAPGMWPAQVALLDPATPAPYDAQFCGGTRVAPGWFVTAAHCVEAGGRFMTPAQVQIGHGTTVLSQMADRLNVIRIVPYPNRRPAGSAERPYDIALLQTDRDGGGAAPALGVNRGPATASTGWIAGWGRSDDGYPDGLRAGRVDVYSRRVCHTVEPVPWGTICSHNPDGRDACDGDSGGPLIDALGRRPLIGVTSYGSDDCDDVGVYTSIGHYRDWILRVVGGAGDGSVSMPEIGTLRLTRRGANLRGAVTWCQTGARGHAVRVVLRLGRGQRGVARTLTGTVDGRCMEAEAMFPRSALGRGGWRLTASVADRTERLTSVELEGPVLRV